MTYNNNYVNDLNSFIKRLCSNFNLLNIKKQKKRIFKLTHQPMAPRTTLPFSVSLVLLLLSTVLGYQARGQDVDKDFLNNDQEAHDALLHPQVTIHIMTRKSRMTDLRSTLLSLPQDVVPPVYETYVYLIQDDDSSDSKVSFATVQTYERLIKAAAPSARLVVSPNMTDYTDGGAEALLFSEVLSVAPYIDLMTAFNISRRLTRGRAALYLDASTTPSPGFSTRMTAAIDSSAARGEKALYTCTVLNSDQETVYRVGADFTSGKVGSTSWYSSTTSQDWPKNPPVPKYPFQGHSIHHPGVAKYTEPYAITHECFFATTETLSIIGGNTEHILMCVCVLETLIDTKYFFVCVCLYAYRF